MLKARITMYAPPDVPKNLEDEEYDKIASVLAAWAGEVLGHPVAVRILMGGGSPYHGPTDRVFRYRHGQVDVGVTGSGRGMTIDPFSGPYSFEPPHHYGHSCHPSCCYGRGLKQAPMFTVRDELMRTWKGKRQNEPGLEWWPGSQPTVRELIEFLEQENPEAKIRIGGEGVTKYIAVQV
jgi:hypothetical protein